MPPLPSPPFRRRAFRRHDCRRSRQFVPPLVAPPVLLLLLLLAAGAGAAKVSLKLNPATQFVEVVTSARRTAPAEWNRLAQGLIVRTAVGPTNAAEAFGAVHTAMYDAWAAFDETAIPFAGPRHPRIDPALRRRPRRATRLAAGFAAFFALRAQFPAEARALRMAATKSGLLPPPAHGGSFDRKARRIGWKAANAVLKRFRRERMTDVDDTPFRTAPHTCVVDRWRPERVPIDDPAGRLQQFLTPTFGRRAPFALGNGKAFRPPPPPPFLLQPGVVDISARSVTLANGTTLRVSRDLIGSVINARFVQQCREVLRFSAGLDDGGKLSAEFWEDGPGTSFPPGTWLTFAQFVSARDDHSYEQDLALFLLLGNAVRDAGIATWNAKAFFYYARPVRAVRDLAELRLLGRYTKPANVQTAPMYCVPLRRACRYRLDRWLTYQTPMQDPSPPFPEYTSGHSAFSAAGAEALRRFTKSDTFGGAVTFGKGTSRFEPGTTPTKDVTMRWASFSDAAEAAGLSRLYGGIHFMDGHTHGAYLGRRVGEAVFDKVQQLVTGMYNP